MQIGEIYQFCVFSSNNMTIKLISYHKFNNNNIKLIKTMVAMRGYSLQTTDSHPSLHVGDDRIKKWLGHFGDVYTDSEAFIKHVNRFIQDEYYACEYDEREYDDSKINEWCEQYHVNEKILDNIKVGEYYNIYHKDQGEINYIIVCHNIVIM